MFGQSVENAWYFESAVHLEAQNRLMYVAEQGEAFVLLLAAQGMGKTRLLNRVQEECRRFGHSVVLMNVAAMDDDAFLWHLCGGLSIIAQDHPSRSEMMLAIRDEISGRTLCHHQTVLLLDDLNRAGDNLHGMIQFLMAVNQQTGGGISVIAAADGTLCPQLQQLSALRVGLPQLSDDDSLAFVAGCLKSLKVRSGRVTADGMGAIVESCAGSPDRLTRTCELLKIAQSTHPGLTINADVLAVLTEETLVHCS
ncbi:MAG: ATP-binding protein [Planctomycetaceae bacterium]